MLSIGMVLNGFQVTQISAQFRAGKPDGAVILAVRHSDGEHVTARVEQVHIDAEESVTVWGNGHYYTSEDGPSKAMRDFLDRAGLTTAYTVLTVRQSKVTAQSTRALSKWLDSRGQEELTKVLGELHYEVTGADGDVRIMIERV